MNGFTLAQDGTAGAHFPKGHELSQGENVADYSRFTDRVRNVMQLASQEAQRFNHEYVDSGHILLGLIKEGSGIGANCLKNFGVDLAHARREFEKISPTGPDMVTMGKLPHTPRVRKIIEYAIEEADSLKHSYVGTEHIALAILRDQEGIAFAMLMALGVDAAALKKELLFLQGYGEKQAATETKTYQIEVSLPDEPEADYEISVVKRVGESGRCLFRQVVSSVDVPKLARMLNEKE